MTPAVLDIIIATILLISTAVAMYRGIIREVFTIVGLGAATVGAYMLGPGLIPVFNKWLHVPEGGGDKAAEAVSRSAGADPVTNVQAVVAGAAHKSELLLGLVSPGLAAKAAAYGATFIVIFLLMSLISFFLSRGVHEAGLGFLDRLCGAAFGFARGFVLVFLPYVLCTFLITPDKFPDWAKNSVSVPLLQQAYVYADAKFDLKKRIEDRGGSIALKIDKIDPGKDIAPVEKELKSDLSTDDKQKAPVMP